VRKERQKQGPVKEVRPEELKAADLERNEKSNLSSICKNIYSEMNRTRTKACERANEEAESILEEPSEEETIEILARHNLCQDEGLQLLKFALHPTSFGQTVENLFYISFLIKENLVGIRIDDSGLISMRRLSFVHSWNWTNER